MKISQEKSFLTLTVPSILKIIEKKNDINFYNHTSFCYFPCYSGLGRQVFLSNSYHFCFLINRDTEKQNLKYKSKTNLLLHYSNLFSDSNFGILFIIIVLQYAPKYHQNPIPRHLIYFVSQSRYIRTSPIVRMVAGINNIQCKHLSKQFY